MTKGKKPTPGRLHLVEGTFRSDRHGPVAAVERAQSTFGDIQMPSHFKGEAMAAWERYIEPAWWLDASREPCAIAFCELWHRLRKDPAAFPAALHVQLRSYMAELGLTNERMRFGVGRDKGGDEFFD